MTTTFEQFMNTEKKQDIIKTLKSGPDFGFAGCKMKNLYAILENAKKGIVFTHYFGVNENEKQSADNKFYSKLCSSVYCALGFSDFKINDEHNIEGIPSLILGINTKTNPLGIPMIKNDSTPFYADGVHTFGIGHDFVGTRKYFDINPLIIGKSEVNNIQQEMDSVDLDIIVKNYFAVAKMTEKMIGKIYDKIKLYRKNQNDTSK